jgi:hypothetical protein
VHWIKKRGDVKRGHNATSGKKVVHWNKRKRRCEEGPQCYKWDLLFVHFFWQMLVQGRFGRPKCIPCLRTKSEHFEFVVLLDGSLTIALSIGNPCK